MKRCWCIFLMAFVYAILHAESPASVSMLISEPDYSHFYTTYGHAAFRVQNNEYGVDVVFDQVGEHLQNRFMSFLMGDLKMGLQRMGTADFISSERESLTIHEYPLMLPDSMLLALCYVLHREAERGFVDRYDPIRGSCCQVLVKHMNEAARLSGTPLVYPESEDFDMTIRELCHKYSQPCPWTEVVANILSGAPSDKPYIAKSRKILYVAQVVPFWTDMGILGEETILSQGKPSTPPALPPIVVAIAFFVVCALCWLKPVGKWMNIVILALVTAMGLAEYYLLLCSPFSLAGWNILMLTFNPLMAVCWRWRRYWALPYAGVLVLVLVWVSVSHHILMIPFFMIITAAICVWLIAIKVRYLPSKIK